MIDVFTDGSGCNARRNSTVAGWGFVAVDDMRVIHHDCGQCEGEGLESEIIAVIEALRWLAGRKAYIWCDNEVIDQRLNSQCGLPLDGLWRKLVAELREGNATLCLFFKRTSRDFGRFHKMAHNLANQGRKGAREFYLRDLATRTLDEHRSFKPRQIWGAQLRSPISIPAS